MVQATYQEDFARLCFCMLDCVFEHFHDLCWVGIASVFPLFDLCYQREYLFLQNVEDHQNIIFALAEQSDLICGKGVVIRTWPYTIVPENKPLHLIFDIEQLYSIIEGQ